MSADKLAKALQRLIKANPVAMNNVQVDAAMEAHKALASHESEKQEPTVWIGKGQLREVLNGNAMSVYMIDKQDRFTDVPLYASPQQEPELIDLVKELQASLIDATALIDELQQKPDRLDAANIVMAVARGWCHPINAKKVMDSDLALAIAAEVSAAIDAAKEAK